jgi:hypothetical protein
MRKNKYLIKLIALFAFFALMSKSFSFILHEHNNNSSKDYSLVDDTNSCFFCKFSQNQFIHYLPQFIIILVLLAIVETKKNLANRSVNQPEVIRNKAPPILT